MMYYQSIDASGYPGRGPRCIITRNKKSSVYCKEYRYNVAWFLELDQITPETMKTAAKWCDQNLVDDWLVGSCVNGFDDEKDAMAFKLRWL